MFLRQKLVVLFLLSVLASVKFLGPCILETKMKEFWQQALNKGKVNSNCSCTCVPVTWVAYLTFWMLQKQNRDEFSPQKRHGLQKSNKPPKYHRP